jgi:hypothetical protein
LSRSVDAVGVALADHGHDVTVARHEIGRSELAEVGSSSGSAGGMTVAAAALASWTAMLPTPPVALRRSRLYRGRRYRRRSSGRSEATRRPS